MLRLGPLVSQYRGYSGDQRHQSLNVTGRRWSSKAGALVAFARDPEVREIAESSFSMFWDLGLDRQIRTEAKGKPSKSLRSGRLFQTKDLPYRVRAC